MVPIHRQQRRGRLARFVVAAFLSLAAAGLHAADIDEGFEGPDTSWTLAESDAAPQLALHERTPAAPHHGDRCERLQFSAATGTVLRLQMPLGRLAVIDELSCGLWVRASRPDVRLSVRVLLPGSVSRKTGRPVETLVPGTLSTDIDRWELLEVQSLPQRLAGQLPALRMEHGAGLEATGAVATHLVLDVYTGPGGYDVSIDDLRVIGAVPASAAAVQRSPGQAIHDPLVQPVAAEAAVLADAPTPLVSTDPPAGITRGVLEVDGLPFFPRSLDHSGEPLASIAALGFNCVRLASPAGSDLLAEARRAGLWVICPPPEIPDVDVRDLESMPTLRNWDRVLMWDMGSGLAAGDLESLAERARRVRACDLREGRPLIAAPESSLRSLSRHVDLLVARRTVLGTSLELIDYLRWLRERPRLARPGTPLLAELATEIDPRAARQAAAIAGVGGQGLAVDPESLSLAALTAVAAGARGILFSSSTRIDGDDAEARKRAAAAREMNLRLKVLEPFGAAGRFAAQAHASDPEVQAVVMEAARARVVMAWRCVQGSQIVARRYRGADIPTDDDVPLTLLVPGVPEAHQAWEIAPGGLKPLRQQRVTGGVSVTLDSFLTQSLVLISGEPAVTAHVQERIRELAPVELVSARSLASVALADAATLLGRLPPQAFSGPPPVAAGPMLSMANQLAAEGESYVGRDAGEAIARLRKAAAIAGQFERRIWENGVHADGSMVASPLVSSDAALAEHWRFVEARATAVQGAELVPGGGMDRIEDLAGNGWRHFVQPLPEITTAVEISKASPAAGAGCLRIVAGAKDRSAAPVVVETPPAWVTTPPISAPPGRLLEISAQVRVEKPILGSVDGLMVFDSLGGPALAERVGPTKAWRRLVLYRIVPPDGGDEPFTVTFALTGLGAAQIDEVSIRPLERGAAGLVATPPVAPTDDTPGRFPSPQQLLVSSPVPPAKGADASTSSGAAAALPFAPPATPPTAPPFATAPPAAPAAAPQWPGMKLEWPQLPFGQSSNAPPPGPGGGTIDPFKRARAAQP